MGGITAPAGDPDGQCGGAEAAADDVFAQVDALDACKRKDDDAALPPTRMDDKTAPLLAPSGAAVRAAADDGELERNESAWQPRKFRERSLRRRARL